MSESLKSRNLPRWSKVVNWTAALALAHTLQSCAPGRGGEDLSSVDFAPGEAVLAPSEIDKVRKLAKLLYERPALTLQIAGACAPTADCAALARRNLQQRLKKLRAEERAAAGQPVQGVESVHLDSAEYADLLKKLYERTYGPEQVSSSPSNIPLPSSNPPPDKAPKLVYLPSWSEANSQGASVFVKGGERLMQHERAQPAAPPTIAPSNPEVARMEQRLLADIRVTDDELRELEQMRAQAVRSALLELGRIPPERVIILAPKPINPATAGETRANFSLE
jgi:hypothetical protein